MKAEDEDGGKKRRGEKKESDRVIVRERCSGTVQLWDRIKQSLLCQQLNTPAERTSSIVEAASTKTTIADVKLRFLMRLYQNLQYELAY